MSTVELNQSTSKQCLNKGNTFGLNSFPELASPVSCNVFLCLCVVICLSDGITAYWQFTAEGRLRVD